MKKGNGIKKGKSFEREIANFLTRTTNVKWHRTPMSGAFQTSYNTNSVQFKGDVFTEDEQFKDIVIECKSYKELSPTDFFSPKSKIRSWIKQSEEEAKDKPWLLFFKINRIGTFLLYDIDLNYEHLAALLIRQILQHKKHQHNICLDVKYKIYMLNISIYKEETGKI